MQLMAKSRRNHSWAREAQAVWRWIFPFGRVRKALVLWKVNSRCIDKKHVAKICQMIEMHFRSPPWLRGFKRSSDRGFMHGMNPNEGASLLQGCPWNCPMESLSRFSDQELSNSVQKNHQAQIVAPAYIRVPKPPAKCPLTGLCRSTLIKLISGPNPPVASKILRGHGRGRGIRLIDVKSLLAFIDSLPDAGVDHESTTD